MVAEGVKMIELVVTTLTLLLIDWRRVCCCWLPAYTPTVQAPKVARGGVVPSSFQEIVHGVPAVQVVEATGAVMKRVASAEGAKARAKTARVERNIVCICELGRGGFGVWVGFIG